MTPNHFFSAIVLLRSLARSTFYWISNSSNDLYQNPRKYYSIEYFFAWNVFLYYVWNN